MINRVVLMGRLVADPELKTTASGVSVTRFRVAVDRSFVRQGEERKADFINVVCWRNQAEFVNRYFTKGSMIAVDGRLQTDTYQAKDGTNRYSVEVVADNVSFTGSRRESGGYGDNRSYGAAQDSYNNSSSHSYDREPAQQPPAAYQSGSDSDFQDMPLDDDLPF